MRDRKQPLVNVAAILVLALSLAAPAIGAAAPIVDKAPEAKILGVPPIGCDPAKLSYVLDGGNVPLTCGGKSTMVGHGWEDYVWPGAIGSAYYYVSAKKGEDGTERISFFPTITLAGYYEAWVSYRGSENRSAATPFFVYPDANVVYKVIVNQKEAGAGAFFSVKLGTFFFKAHALNQTPRATGIVACVNEGRGSSESVDALFLRYVRPAAPNSVAASDATSTNTIDVTWKPVYGAKGYKIYRNTTNSTTGAQLIATLGVAARSFHDTPLGEGETYYYWMKTVGALGKMSAFSKGDAGSTGVTTP